jgi:hypothetical protein
VTSLEEDEFQSRENENGEKPGDQRSHAPEDEEKSSNNPKEREKALQSVPVITSTKAWMPPAKPKECF